MVMRKEITNKDDWLTSRMFGIGGSEAASVVGLNPYQSAEELMNLKLGLAEPKDLKTNEAVQRGIRTEPVMRELYQAIHPEVKVEYHQYDLLYQEERPWLYATLDGELHGNEQTGVLEIKVCQPRFKGWDTWKGQVPDYYYVQILHQLLATDFDYSVLYACLIADNGELTIREYEFVKNELKDDMNWLLEKETEFWNEIRRRQKND